MTKEPDKVANRVGNGMTQSAMVGVALAVPGPEDFVLAGAAATAVGKAVVRGAAKLFGDGIAAVGRAIQKAPCNCFVADTQVAVVGGSIPIEQVHRGDRVLALASTEPGAWLEVPEADPAPKRSEIPSRSLCAELARASRKAALPLLLAGCEPAVAAVTDLAPVATVYEARSGTWREALTEDLEVGDELVLEGHLLRVTEEGVEHVGPVDLGQLEDADVTWAAGRAPVNPDATDWVLGLEHDGGFAHVRLGDLTLDEHGEARFAFGGRIFDARAEPGELAIRPTGEVLGYVYRTHVRPALELIDVSVTGAGGLGSLTATPDHPFWVGATEGYVPLGELEVGTVLRTVGGGDAAVGSMDWRAADAEVFNFEVRDVHNYFVQSVGGNGAVLVHNGCGGAEKVLGKYDVAPGVDMPSASGKGTGRARNKLKPDQSAAGPHSTSKMDESGNITGHAEWQPNPRNPSGFDQAKRVDTQHAKPHAHGGVPTPHTHEPKGGIRKATPDELPN